MFSPEIEEGSTVTTFAQFGQNNMTRPTTRQPEKKKATERIGMRDEKTVRCKALAGTIK